MQLHTTAFSENNWFYSSVYSITQISVRNFKLRVTCNSSVPCILSFKWLEKLQGWGSLGHKLQNSAENTDASWNLLPKSLVSVFSKLSVRTKINQLQLVALVCFPANRQILFLLFRANILILLLWFFDKSGITFNSVPSSPLKKTFLVLIKNCHVHVIKWCNPVYFFFIPGWFSSQPNYTYSSHCRDSSRIAFCCICK